MDESEIVKMVLSPELMYDLLHDIENYGPFLEGKSWEDAGRPGEGDVSTMLHFCLCGPEAGVERKEALAHLFITSSKLNPDAVHSFFVGCAMPKWMRRPSRFGYGCYETAVFTHPGLGAAICEHVPVKNLEKRATQYVEGVGILYSEPMALYLSFDSPALLITDPGVSRYIGTLKGKITRIVML